MCGGPPAVRCRRCGDRNAGWARPLLPGLHAPHLHHRLPHARLRAQRQVCSAAAAGPDRHGRRPRQPVLAGARRRLRRPGDRFPPLRQGQQRSHHLRRNHRRDAPDPPGVPPFSSPALSVPARAPRLAATRARPGPRLTPASSSAGALQLAARERAEPAACWSHHHTHLPTRSCPLPLPLPPPTLPPPSLRPPSLTSSVAHSPPTYQQPPPQGPRAYARARPAAGTTGCRSSASWSTRSSTSTLTAPRPWPAPPRPAPPRRTRPARAEPNRIAVRVCLMLFHLSVSLCLSVCLSVSHSLSHSHSLSTYLPILITHTLSLSI